MAVADQDSRVAHLVQIDEEGVHLQKELIRGVEQRALGGRAAGVGPSAEEDRHRPLRLGE